MNSFTQSILKAGTPLFFLAGLIGYDTPILSSHYFGSQPAIAQTQTIASQIYQKASPAVVTIKSANNLGSGFIVSNKGLILTNAHVISEGVRTVTVLLSDGKEVTAKVIGFSQNGEDLAALQLVDRPPLKTLSLATTNTTQVGQSIFVIGTPFSEAYQNTLTSGMISRLDQSSGILQHSASLNPGSSGSPVLNGNGEVVGINYGVDMSRPVYNSQGQVSGRTVSGHSFAISINRVKGFIQDIHQGNLSSVSTLVRSKKQGIPVVAPNSKIVGALTPNDFDKEGKNPMDFYRFEGKKKQVVNIFLQSSEFDPLLVLYRVTVKDGRYNLKLVGSNDDRLLGDRNSQLYLSLPKNGFYLLGVGSASGRQGNYVMQMG